MNDDQNAWFRNSKIRDMNGNPLLVYHGTKNDFSSFAAQLGADAGYHFGTLAQANMRAAGGGKKIVSAYLRIENPKRMKDTGQKWSKAQLAAAKRQGYDGIVYLNRYEGTKTENVVRAHEAGVDLDRMSDKEFKKWFPEAEDSYVAFDNEQILIVDFGKE